jgi:uncharacterized protein (TIGR02271 family)
MIKKLTYVAGIVSVAGVLSACSTTHRTYASNDRYANDVCGDKHQSTYSSASTEYEASGAQAQANVDTGAQQSQAGGDQVVIPLFEERVNVGKQAIPGQVQIRKYTTTETVNVPVQLRHEHVVVERTTGGQTSQSDWSAAPFQDKAITIQVQQEQPLVQKQTVQTGQVVARKDSQMQQMNVQQQIRREDVTIDRNGNTANVEIRGNFNEAAGAQTPQQGQQGQQGQDRDRDNDKDQR